MIGAWITIGIVTLIWALIGGVGPFILPKGPNRGVYQTMIVLTAVCCWLHWFITYMSQLNPLMGPTLTRGEIYLMGWVW
uniref:V-type proton ATPase subunit n=1 Tax=Ciona intestinalis TaxID=7719 RepID=H2XLR4_CIOIN